MHAEARSWHRWPPYMLRQSFSLTLEVPNSVHLAIRLALDALCLLSSQIAGWLGWGYELWPSCIWGKLFIWWVISPGQDIQLLKHFTSPNSWESGSKGKKSLLNWQRKSGNIISCHSQSGNLILFGGREREAAVVTSEIFILRLILLRGDRQSTSPGRIGTPCRQPTLKTGPQQFLHITWQKTQNTSFSCPFHIFFYSS